MIERRAFPRWMVALECQAIGKDGTSRGVISELSEHGAGFISGRAAELGEELQLEWKLNANESPIRVSCVVRDVTARLIGVEFLDLSREDRLKLAGYFTPQRRS